MAALWRVEQRRGKPGKAGRGSESQVRGSPQVVEIKGRARLKWL